MTEKANIVERFRSVSGIVVMVIKSLVCFPHRNKWNVTHGGDQLNTLLFSFLRACYEPFKRDNIGKFVSFSIRCSVL